MRQPFEPMNTASPYRRIRFGNSKSFNTLDFISLKTTRCIYWTVIAIAVVGCLAVYFKYI